MSGETNVTYLEKLYLIQKKIVRIMHAVNPRTHTKPFFEGTKILNIFKINKYIIRKFMCNVLNLNTLDIFTSMFAYNSSIHAHDTRQSDHFHVPMIKKELRKSNIYYRGTVIWYDVMKCNVKTTESDYVFCRDFKKKLSAGVL